ncbi:MAG: YnbE family lipoprotein [Gammaproteobacteria bacterium]|nr:YnbE family lipoprotein [Gammaproteobacteria bacterium]
MKKSSTHLWQAIKRFISRPLILTATLLSLLAMGCTPKVEVTASDKPITINLNVKIEHEIRVKVEKELEDILSEDSGLF